jgi:hypothetical protein
MTSTSAERITRAMGFALGLGVAATIVLVSTPSTSAAGLTATVRFMVPMTGELAVTPVAPHTVLLAEALRPASRPAGGRFRVQNQTGRTIRLGFRAHRSSTSLDALVHVRLSAAGRPLAETTLQGLARTTEALWLPSGAARWIDLRAWMPANAGDGYEGRQVDVSLVPVIIRSRG